MKNLQIQILSAVALLVGITVGCGTPTSTSKAASASLKHTASHHRLRECAYPITQGTPFCLTEYGTISGTVLHSTVADGFGWVIFDIDGGWSQGSMFPPGKIETRAGSPWWTSVIQPNGVGTLPITFNSTEAGNTAMSETVDSIGPNTVSITLTIRSCTPCGWYGSFYRAANVQVKNKSENYFMNTTTLAEAYSGPDGVSLSGDCAAIMSQGTAFDDNSSCGTPETATLESAPGILYARSQIPDMSMNGYPQSVEFVYTFW